jgi:hypothetical protein
MAATPAVSGIATLDFVPADALQADAGTTLNRRDAAARVAEATSTFLMK